MSIKQLISEIKSEGLLRAGAKLEKLYNMAEELEAENARLRQQLDAANAQLDFILENLKEEKAP